MTNPNQRRLVIINQDVGYLFVDLANAALQYYDEVVLVSGSVVELGSRLDERVKQRSMVRYRRKSVVSRFVSWIAGFVNVVWLLRTQFRGYEVLAATNPPLNTLLPLVLSNRAALYVLDLYPEALHETGMVSKRNWLVLAWAWLNARGYQGFRAIWALTPSMKRVIEQGYRVEVGFAPGWASAVGVPGAEMERRPLESSDGWIVLYSGNLGREHDVEILLDCAGQLLTRSDIVFVIAGEGWKKRELADRVDSEKLNNVQLLSKLPAKEFAALLSRARVGVVTQSLRTAEVCIPSKTFNLLAAGIPILGIGNPGSDFGKLIHDGGAGRVFQPDQVDEICEFLVGCRSERHSLSELQQSALKLSESFTNKNAERLLGQFALANESDD